MIKNVQSLVQKTSSVIEELDETDIKRHQDASRALNNIVYPVQEIIVDIDEMITLASWLSDVASRLNIFKRFS